jgi:hypothetical protein
MKNLVLIICFFLSSMAVIAQTSITIPGSNKSMNIDGVLLGEIIRSTGGVDKTLEKYYYKLSNESLTIWKHSHLIQENTAEILLITVMPLADIDWAYFESTYPNGPITKKFGGEEYYLLSINIQRGKRFKQKNYYQSSKEADVTVGNIDININDADAIKGFYDKLISAKK